MIFFIKNIDNQIHSKCVSKVCGWAGEVGLTTCVSANVLRFQFGQLPKIMTLKSGTCDF